MHKLIEMLEEQLIRVEKYPQDSYELGRFNGIRSAAFVAVPLSDMESDYWGERLSEARRCKKLNVFL